MKAFCSEVDNIKIMLGCNGYPAYLLDSCVRIFFNRKYDKMLSHHEESKNFRTVVARLPFLGDMSMQFKKSFPAWWKSRHGTKLFYELSTPP